MSGELEHTVLRQWQWPTTLHAALQGCGQQLGQSLVSFLQDGNAEALAHACAQLARIGGLCRMFGARRAALYCSELECLLLHCSAGREQWAHARTQTLAQTNAQVSVQVLLSRAVVRLQHFLVGSLLPAADEVFDVSCINALRQARGKAVLPLEVSCPDASTARASVTNTISPGARSPVPDFLQCALEKVEALQATLRNVAGADAQAAREQRQHLADLASLLEVCGLSLEMRRLPVALVHLELHFRFLSTCCSPCTPERIANTARLAAADYLLVNGRGTLIAILSHKLDTLLHALAQTVHAGSGLNSTRSLARAAQDFVHIHQSLVLLAHAGMMSALSSGQDALLQHGVQLCRHVSCSVTERFLDEDNARSGALVLIRVCLSLQKALTMQGREDRHSAMLERKICRDSARFIQRNQNVLRHHMLELHRVDSEAFSIADKEIASVRSTLCKCLEETRVVQGIHYISEALCTSVSRLSQILLVTGQVEFHEIVEQLRECLTLGFEQQQCIEDELQNCIAALCELLQQPLPMNANQVWCSQPQSQMLCDCVDRCVRQMRLLRDVDDSAVSIVCLGDSGQQSRAPIAVAQLPVHLARNIRDLLCSAEELATCAENPDRFEGLNRRLIVELRMLATGARALRVDRVAALSAVLAEVHQEIAGVSEWSQTVTGNERALPLALLVNAHRQLRSGLNQAAARQEVSSNRDVVAALYQWLEDHAAHGSTDDAEGFAIFHREAEEIMASIEESARNSAAALDTATLLLHLHTLKGNARLFGADEIATLSHRFEQLLQEVTEKHRFESAVAECVPGVSYALVNEKVVEQRRPEIFALLHALRTAVDGLVSRTVRAQGVGVDTENCRSPQRIPLAQAYERGIVIPAVSLQRMAELATAAKTGSRAMSDVLQSYRCSAEPSRLSLLADLLVEQDRCTIQLDEEIAGSTRISFARLTQRLQRLVGRHANLLDKQVSFHVRHDELRADRVLIESLVAPIEQLLRNAIDHGIEPVMQRRARGKPDVGTITLSLEEEDKRLVIVLRDDGAGVDPDALLAHAMRLGIDIDPEAGASERLRWLFLPGFSSRESATEDAGHGIGLALVSSAVAALGGSVEVESVPGQSCCFRIALPR